MGNKKQDSYDFLRCLVVSIMGVDSLITYEYLEYEISISSKTLAKMRRGSALPVYQYVRVVSYILESINLVVLLDELLKVLTKVLCSRCDLVIAAVPHSEQGKYEPKEWVVVMRWDNVCR